MDGQNGEWVGVEWDDQTRGRHDGVLNGQRYFDCVQPGGLASFVRNKRLQKQCSLVEAITQKYAAEEGAFRHP